MKRKFILPLALAWLSACVGTLPPPAPSVLTKACAHDPIPAESRQGALLFVTTRLPDCRVKGRKHKPDDNRGILMTVHRSDISRPGWFSIDASIRGNSKEARKSVTPLMLDDDEWGKALHDQLTAGKGTALLFIHGYNNDFAYPAERLNRIRAAGAFHGPMILFSWPSQNSTPAYSLDETNSDWTQFYLNALIRKLTDDRQVQNLILVSHSMGARGVVSALETLPDGAQQKIQTVILASPDIDRDRFSQLLNAKSSGLPERHYTIYVSAKDKAIAASRAIHYFPRLGAPDCTDRKKGTACYPTSSPAMDVVDTTAVSDSTAGHADFIDSIPVQADLSLALNGGKGRIGARQPIPGQNPDAGLWRLCSVKKGWPKDEAKKAR